MSSYCCMTVLVTEETPAGKVRPESAARGKQHDEVSSATTTQKETKTEEVRNPLPQTTLRPIFRSKDFSGWKMNRGYFLKYSQTYGPFDLDGATYDERLNSQVAEDFCCPARPFKERDLQKYRRIWLNAPFNELEDFLGHHLRSKLLHPHMRAVIVVPKWRAKSWFKLMRNFRLVDELAATEHVLTCPTNDGIDGRRHDVEPTRWTTQVYVDDTDRVQFLPQNLQLSPETHWTHWTTLVTDGRRVLLAKEDTCMVWFPDGKQDIEDATPEYTTMRSLTEITGFKVTETNLRLLGTESSGQNKHYVYIARVRPGSIPNATLTSRAIWATRKELILARLKGYLVRGDQQFPLRYETFGKPIDGWIIKSVRLEDGVLATLHVSIT
jgi:hypothetical protein